MDSPSSPTGSSPRRARGPRRPPSRPRRRASPTASWPIASAPWPAIWRPRRPPGNRVLLALPNTPRRSSPASRSTRSGATAVEVSREWSAEVLAGIVHAERRPPGDRLGPRRPHVGHGCRAPARAALGGAPGPLPRALRRGARRRRRATALLEDGRVDPDLAAAPPPPAPELARTGRAHPLHLGQHREAARGRPDLPQHRREHAVDRRVPRPHRRGPGAAHPAALLLLRPQRAPDAPVRRWVASSSTTAWPSRAASWRRLAAEGCTGFAGVPLTFEVIRRQVDVSTIAFPRLRYLTQAGGAMAPDTIAWVRAAFQPGPALRDVRTDRGHGAPLLPAARAGRREGRLHRHPDPRRRAAGRGRAGARAAPRRGRASSSPAATT